MIQINRGKKKDITTTDLEVATATGRTANPRGGTAV